MSRARDADDSAVDLEVVARHVKAWETASGEAVGIASRAIGAELQAEVERLSSGFEALVEPEAEPILFLHPLLLVNWTMPNRWLYRPQERLKGAVVGLFRRIDFADRSSLGDLRTECRHVVAEIAHVLTHWEFLARVATAEPGTGADPLGPTREDCRETVGWALRILHACWETDRDLRSTLIHGNVADGESLETNLPGVLGPDAASDPATSEASVYDAVAAECSRLETDRQQNEVLLRVGHGQLTWNEPGRAGDVWGWQLDDLRAIGAGYVAFAGLRDEAKYWVAPGQCAVRLALDAPDPLLAYLSAECVFELARGVPPEKQPALSELHARFWAEIAPKVTDRGFDESREFAAWEESRDPRRLVAAHGSLLEAVGRHILTATLAIGQEPSAGAVEMRTPPLVGELLDRIGARREEVLFDLVTRCASGHARNAFGHASVTVRHDRVEYEDVHGVQHLVDTSELEFDHQMLRSVLIGVEVGLALFPGAVSGRRVPAVPRIDHTRASFEIAVRNTLHVCGLGRVVSFDWSHGGEEVRVVTLEPLDPVRSRRAILDIQLSSEPGTTPPTILFSVRPRRSADKRSARGRRRNRGRRTRG